MQIEIINWSALSRYLTDTGNKTAIRNNNIPEKYKEEVQQLQHYMECWKEGKRLYTKKELGNEITDKVRQEILKLRSNLAEIDKNLQEYADNVSLLP